MENPATWKEAELVILDAMEAHEEATSLGAIGPSSPHYIADMLRKAGLLQDADSPEIGWDRLRDRKRAH